MNRLFPWCWQSLPLENRTGSVIFEHLFLKNRGIATLLESPFPTPIDSSHLSRYSICAGPPRTWDRQLQVWTPKVGQILPFLQQLLQRGNRDKLPSPDELPFQGGWLGWLGYDLAWEIETLPRLKADPLPFPVAYWYEPATFAVLDHWQQTLWLAATNPQELDRLQQQLESATPISPLVAPSSPHPLTLSFLSSQENYQAAVRQAKKYIQAGDIFQANLSLRFQAATQADGWAIYRTLQAINPSPFASYWRTPWGDLINRSGEQLMRSPQGVRQ